ncbi:MAG: oxidoreductase [Actinomycetota bacterium]|nr:oxidoreductase [Actinomycetota bacterium]
MGLFTRGGGSRKERSEISDALLEWVQGHRGVEVYVEPKTAVTENSILLVAHDGEFTRRRVPSPAAALAFARKHALPIYDATAVGYPQRMRDYSRREMILRQRAQRDALGD